ncbi:MAG: hypothetical protein Q8928_14915 [Bacteroidota bacterium]|nr:hypothetical protein [Bacteroidota bacterium]
MNHVKTINGTNDYPTNKYKKNEVTKKIKITLRNNILYSPVNNSNDDDKNKDPKGEVFIKWQSKHQNINTIYPKKR